MHVLRRVDRRRFRMDFLVHAQRACASDDEIRGLSARIVRGPDPPAPGAISLAWIACSKNMARTMWCTATKTTLVAGAAPPPSGARSQSASLTATSDLRARPSDSYAGDTCGPRIAGSERAPPSAWPVAPRRPQLCSGMTPAIHSGASSRVASISRPSGPLRRASRSVRSWGLAPDDLVLAHVGRFDPEKNDAFLRLSGGCFGCWLLVPCAYLCGLGDHLRRTPADAPAERGDD
jgi:hypothetical protein